MNLLKWHAKKPAAKITLVTKRGRKSLQSHNAIEAWVILTPVLLYYGLFAIVPIFANIGVSFLQWNGITAPDWVGTDNYVRLFTSPFYRQIYLNTAFFTIATMVIGIPLGLLAAILVNHLRGDHVAGYALVHIAPPRRF
jgi:ABC-type sugar transport system permease subunit